MKRGASLLVPWCLASFSIRVLGGTYCESVQPNSYHYVGCNFLLTSVSEVSATYNPLNGGFTAYVFDDVDLAWVPSTPPPIPRGRGALVRIAPAGGTHQICFLEPTQPPTLPLQLFAGLNVVSCQSNIVAQFEDIVGRAPMEGARFARYVGGSPYDPSWPPSSSPFEATNFVSCVYTNGAWTPSVPTAAIGEAVIISEPTTFAYQPAALNRRVSGGNFAFEMETVYGKSVTIEVSDSLPPSWQILTSFTGDGHRKTVLDPISGGGGQKYYRIKSTSP